MGKVVLLVLGMVMMGCTSRPLPITDAGIGAIPSDAADVPSMPTDAKGDSSTDSGVALGGDCGQSRQCAGSDSSTTVEGTEFFVVCVPAKNHPAGICWMLQKMGENCSFVDPAAAHDAGAIDESLYAICAKH